MRWDIALLANGFPEQTKMNLMRLRRGLTRRPRQSSVSQQIAHFDEEKTAGCIIRGALRGNKRSRSRTQVEIAGAIVVAEINGRTRVQQISEKQGGGEWLGRRVRLVHGIKAT